MMKRKYFLQAFTNKKNKNENTVRIFVIESKGKNNLLK